MSRCPIQRCNVRMSTPCRKCSVAKVCGLWRKKCRQYGPSAHLFPCLVTHCPQFNSARSATRLTIMSFSLSGLPFELGKTSCEGSPLRRSRSFRNCSISALGSGTERSSKFLGPNPQRFDCYARQAVTKIDVTPSHITDLTIPKTRAEKKLEKY